MERFKLVALLLILCTSCTFNGKKVQDDYISKRNIEQIGVNIELGSLRITNRIIELRCGIINNTEQDIWVYSKHPITPHGHSDDRGTNAEFYVDTDFQTLIILRRQNKPRCEKVWSDMSTDYTRLCPGQMRPEIITMYLPIVHWSSPDQGFFEAKYRGIEAFTRLAFEIGYFTMEDLTLLKENNSPYWNMSFYESDDRVVIHGSIPNAAVEVERAVRLVVDNLNIPYKKWMHWHYEHIPEESSLTNEEALKDLFYNFSISFEEYRYALCLFHIDENLLDDKFSHIKDVYKQMAEGKIEPIELNEHLDGILNESDREKLLRELQVKQAAVDKQKQERVSELLTEAKQYDNQTDGRKALDILREVISIDPFNDEAINLIQKIGAYYQGEVITNSIGMELCWIPAGEFLMGNSENKEKAMQHKVRISRGFWMGEREVTQEQYQSIMGRNPSRLLNGDEGAVNNVSWYDAVEFCRRLSEKEGKTYRLPTEAEWEYACRAGTSTDYWWGDDEQAVSDKANVFGLYNMHYNVKEWCQEWVGAYYYIISPELDPQGPNKPEQEWECKVTRGGMYNDSSRDKPCPSYVRGFMGPEKKDNQVGFRIVLQEE